MEVEYRCNNCRHTQTLNEINVIKCDAYDKEGNKFRIIYYCCERCGANIVLQIDNTETIVMFDEERKMYINNMRYKLAHQTPSQKQKRKMEKLNKKLKVKREALFLEKAGQTFYEDKKATKPVAKIYS